jgi:hypothetical protein
MTTQLEKVRQELSKVFAMENALQKEIWTKENFEANSVKEDMLSAWANSLQEILNELESNLEYSEFISLNER